MGLSQPAAARIAVAVSSPGSGLARHVRVQFQPARQSDWQLYAYFSTAAPAERCIADLKSRGLHARMVNYRLCPTAA